MKIKILFKKARSIHQIKFMPPFLLLLLFLFQGIFSENAAALSTPSIASVSTTPGIVLQGMTLSATLDGLSLQSGATLSFSTSTIASLSGVVANSVSVNGTGTLMIASLTLSNTALTGPINIILTNPDGGQTTFPSAFSILQAVPSNLTLNPVGVGQGALAKLVALYGTGIQCGVRLSVLDSNGSPLSSVTTPSDPPYGIPFRNQCGSLDGIVLSNVQFFSGSNVFIYLNVPANLNGPVFLKWTNPNGTYGTTPLAINPAPRITGVVSSPLKVFQGSTIDVTLTGAGFENGAVLTGPFIVNSLFVQGETQLIASVTISGEASLSPLDFTLTNPDGGVGKFLSTIPVQLYLGPQTPALALSEAYRIDNGYAITHDSYWNGTWSLEGNTPLAFQDYSAASVVLKPHPFLFQQVMGHLVNQTFEFQIWNQTPNSPGGWGSHLSVQSFGSPRAFDLAYESKFDPSNRTKYGRGLAVYGTPTISYASGGSVLTTGIAYRQIFQDSASCLLLGQSAPCWGDETPVDVPLSGIDSSGPVYLYSVKLLPNPDSNSREILMAYQDNLGNLYVRSWNGVQFSPEVLVSSSTAALQTNPPPAAQVFDLAYMQSNKIGMLAWLEYNTPTAATPKSCLWNSNSNLCLTTTSSPAQTGSASNTNLFQIQLSADPSSDQIAMGTLENSATAGIVEAQIWNQNSWPVTPDLISDLVSPVLSGNIWNNFSLIWKPKTGGSSLFAVYAYFNENDPLNQGSAHYQYWRPGSGWSGDSPISVTAIGNRTEFSSLFFDSDPRTADILGLVRSDNGTFSAVRWDGNAFSWVDYHELSRTGPDINLLPYGFSYFKNFPFLDQSTLQMTDLTTNQVITAPLQGESVRVKISGELIQDFAMLGFPGFSQSNIDTTTVVHQNGIDTITATGTISNSITPGPYDLKVTNPDRSLAVSPKLINIAVNPANPPTVFSVFPSSRGQGAVNQTLTLTGYNFPLKNGSPDFSISFSGNASDITLSSFILVSPVQVTVQTDIAQTAQAGSRDLVLTNLTTGQNYTFPSIFTVNYAPTILGATPSIISQGVNQASFSISGSDFQPGASLLIKDGSSALGWNLPGSVPGSPFLNTMTGNRFYIPPATTPFVVLNDIVVTASLVDPGNTYGQVSIYSDNNGVPGTLIQSSNFNSFIGLPQYQTPNGFLNVNIFKMNLSPPIILSAPARYWVFVNVGGAQTLISYDTSQSACNGDSVCLGFSNPEPFGLWPQPATAVTASNSFTGKRFGISLEYLPILDSTAVGSGSLGTGAYQNKMTGSSLTLAVQTVFTATFAYIGSVDPVNPMGSLAIYSNNNGVPGSLIRQTLSQTLVPNSFNGFVLGKTVLAPGTYWVMLNVGGQTNLVYAAVTGAASIQAPNNFGSWPSPFPTSGVTNYSNTLYSFFDVAQLLTAGNFVSGIHGSDSDQMTGTLFTTTGSSNFAGISYYVSALDPQNQFGSAAIYSDNNGKPGSLIISAPPQQLYPQAFNMFPLSLVQLPQGNYWLIANVNGIGTELSYDNGTSEKSVKTPFLFTNPWPQTAPSGAGAWTSYPGRRYAISVVSDVTIGDPSVLTGGLITGLITTTPDGAIVDLNGNPLTRDICVVNPDGGIGCASLLQITPGTRTNQALVAYGSILSSPYSNFRKWNRTSPWSAETTVGNSSGGYPNWTLLRPFPLNQLPGGRPGEKILGTVTDEGGVLNLTLQVWDGSAWITSASSEVNVTPSISHSRALDIAYENSTGRGVAVYGASGSAIPQYQIWDGAAWSAPLSIPGSPTGTPLWIRLEPNSRTPLTNEMILAYLSGTVNGNGSVTGATLHAMVWNGTSFGNEKILNVGSSLTNLNLCLTCFPPALSQIFDIGYEHAAPYRAILAWGVDGSSTPAYVTWNGTSWSAPQSANQAAGDTGTNLINLKLAGDPNSNQLALGTGTINGQFYIQLWNGTDWGRAMTRSDTTSPLFTLSGEWSLTPVVSPASTGTGFISQLASDSAAFTFFGSEINLIGQKLPNLGIADLYLDGIFKDHIDYYSPNPSQRMVLYSLTSLSNMTHAIRVEPSGLSNQNALIAGGSQVDATAGGKIIGSRFRAIKDSAVSLLNVFINKVDPCSRSIQVALYTDNGGFPGTLLSQATGTPTVAAASCAPPSPLPAPVLYNKWFPMTLSSPIQVSAGMDYWILVNTSNRFTYNGVTYTSSGNSLTYSSGSSATETVKFSWPFGSFPLSFSSTTFGSPSTGVYYAFYAGGQAQAALKSSFLGTAPPITVDSFDTKSDLQSPSVVSTNLLYNIDTPVPPDPKFNMGRNFDLAWEKNSGRLLTVFGTEKSINGCTYINNTELVPYGTRFRKWDPVAGWSIDSLVPIIGNDLVPRVIQLISDTSSNDLFLGVLGNPALVPGVTDMTCTVDPSLLQLHEYEWHNGAWAERQVLASNSSGFYVNLYYPFYTANAESFMAAFDPDSVPPAAITDLAVSAVTSNSVTLKWTPTGDDGNLGKPASYTLAWAASSIYSETDYNNIPSGQKITLLPNQLIPAPSLTSSYAVSYTVASGLSPGQTYYFAVKSTDRSGNVSSVSTNNPFTTTPGGGVNLSFAGVISNFIVVPGSLANNTIQLTWTAPLMNNGGSAGGGEYDLRYCNANDSTCIFPIIDHTSFNAAHPVIATDGTGRNGLSLPHAAGTTEIFNFSGLSSGRTSFGIKICDSGTVDPVTFRCPVGTAENVYPLNLTPRNYPVDLTAVPLDITHLVYVDNTLPASSNLPPSPISDLTITSAVSNSMTLRWTAPGNFGQSGTAAGYDLRFSSSPIDASNFASAQKVLPGPTPMLAGTPQAFEVTHLISANPLPDGTSGITYYFSIETINSSGKVSAISNVVSKPIPPVFDYTPPAGITNLSIVTPGVNKDSVTLSWTATGDDAQYGTAMRYDIRYSEFQIVENGSLTDSNRQIEFKNAARVEKTPAPSPSGTQESFVVAGLSSNHVYYFAIKAFDKASNGSTLSTCFNCPGHTALHSGYNLVSVPYKLPGPNDPDSIFGNDLSKPVTVYQWTSVYSVPSIILEGWGYFLYAMGNNSILKAKDSSGNLLGIPENALSVSVPLQPGWNIIGNPYLHPVYLKDTCVKNGNGPSIPFAAAVNNGWVGMSVYSYDGTQYDAEVYVDPLNLLPPARLSFWNGYWLQLLASNSMSLIYLDTPGACP